MLRKKGESLFLRFRCGGPNRINMDIIEKLSCYIEENKRVNDPFQAFQNLIRPIDDGMGSGISFDSTWYRLFEEIYIDYRDASKKHFDFLLLSQFFEILIKNQSINETWLEIKSFVLANIEKLSLWEYSYNKIFAERDNVQRYDDGTYFAYHEGDLCQITGQKTLEEEKFDYIMSTTLEETGVIYKLSKIISLIFISIDFKENNEKYPKGINIRLPESENNCWFLKWNWGLDRLYGYMKSGWRPHNNYCDPDWLTSDLLAEYSEEILAERETKIFEMPDETLSKQYEEAFDGYPFQYACALDTDLRIGNEKEIYFEFKGKKVRWINGETYLRSILIIPVKEYSIEQETLLDEFISSLVWETQIPIRKIFTAGGPKSRAPIIKPTKNMGGIIIPKKELNYKSEDMNERLILALALYKEGINSNSVYYSFLNYYKIIELLFSGKKRDIIDMLNSSKDFLVSHYAKQIQEIDETCKEVKISFGKYIYDAGRCAIAHAGKIDSTVSPDDREDYIRISKDLPLIKEIARHIIQSGEFDS